MYLGVVKPMEKSEMSNGFSMSDLPGKIGKSQFLFPPLVMVRLW